MRGGALRYGISCQNLAPDFRQEVRQAHLAMQELVLNSVLKPTFCTGHESSPEIADISSDGRLSSAFFLPEALAEAQEPEAYPLQRPSARSSLYLQRPSARASSAEASAPMRPMQRPQC